MASHAHSTPATAATTRARLADAIEAAIAALDALDDDPDLEPILAGYPAPGALDEGEPDEEAEDGFDAEQALGWPEYVGRGAGRLTTAGEIAQALGDESEPSLGSPERQPSGWGPWGFSKCRRSSQVCWDDGSDHDREADGGDEREEGDGDAEPDLGALNFASVPEIVERDAEGRAGRVVVLEGCQFAWANGTSDREADAGDEGEAEQPDADGEFAGGDRFGADLRGQLPYHG